MAPRKKNSLPLSPPISIGNCEVIVEAKDFNSELNQNNLQISIPKNAKIKISVAEEMDCGKTNKDVPVLGTQENGDYYFVLVNPKESDGHAKSLLKEALDIYSIELPAMNYAANTGKESMFLERCVSNGKYCTLLLRFKGDEGQEEAVSAITYQIVPADTQYAEIPLAAVRSKYQKKGIGCFLYMELRKRLQRVGIRTILCWGDNESEGFWLKQGFVVIGEVNKRGRARRLPIKADIRKALCFPGGSTLMVSHIGFSSAHPEELIKLPFPLKLLEQHCSSDTVLKQQQYIDANLEPSNGLNQITRSTGDSPPDDMTLARFLTDGGNQDLDCLESANCWNTVNDLGEHKSCEPDGKVCSSSGEQTKKRIWEASCTSLKSKKVKGGHVIECQSDARGSASGSDVRNNCPSMSSAFFLGNQFLVDEDTLTDNCLEKNDENCRSHNVQSKHHVSCEDLSTEKCFKVMLMNIADYKKKSGLTKIIEDLGGFVTPDGTQSTHIVTGKVRKTLNFCVGLCSGAWVISPSWLKESFRKGRFVEEMPFILNDADYESKYGTELKLAVVRAREKPNCLLKGYDICLAAHVQPPLPTLSAIVKSAGGNVICGLDKVKEPSNAVFIACDEDVEEAILAIKKGIPTFSSDWLMNCIMTQQLDLEAPRFAECSL